MKKTPLIIAGFIGSFGLGLCVNFATAKQPEVKQINNPAESLKLGAFSVSLSVKDLKASKAFYENLGFTQKGGAMEQNYVVLKNDHAIIGLFQGMFEGTMLTFNPGWDENAKNVDKFDDVRIIQKQIKSKGTKIEGTEVDENGKGMGSFTVRDPDGNVLLFDQFR